MTDDQFVDFLKQHKDCSIYLTSAPGNSGDLLLQKGLELYLENNNFSVAKNSDESDIILMHGGGSIDDVWRTGLEHFVQLIQRYNNKKIVVAPSTCHFFKTNFENILNSCSQEIYFFTRENNSFKLLQTMNLNSNIHINLANDTAFLLQGTQYLERLKNMSTKKYVLFAMRTNRESAIVSCEWYPHKNNLWEKIKYAYIMWTIKRFLKRECPHAFAEKNKLIVDASNIEYETFIHLITHASEIYTDRLHVSILGAMLGKKVHLFRTKYDKVLGVYKQSLSNYPNVITHFD